MTDTIEAATPDAEEAIQEVVTTALPTLDEIRQQRADKLKAQVEGESPKPEDEPEDEPEDGPGDAPFDHASLDTSAPPRDEDPESRRPRRDRAVLSRPAGLAHPGELGQHCQARGKGH